MIDAHTHVWDLDLTPQPWIEPEAASVLERNFSLEELKQEAAGSGVAASVIVQTVNDLAETQHLLKESAHDPFVAGIVGWVDFSAADSEDKIERLLSGPGGHQLKGFRHVFDGAAADGWLHRGRVNATLRAVGRLNLSFDLLLSATELPLALWVARRHPETTFVLDHLAKPNVRRGELDPWRDHLAALAQAPNVYAKISGLPGEADWQDWSAAQLAPYFEAAFDAFTPDRLLFATDWPVCTVAGEYGRVVAAQLELCSGLSTTERRKVLIENALTVYGLRPR